MADKQAVKQVDIGKGEDKEKWVKHYSSKHHISLSLGAWLALLALALRSLLPLLTPTVISL